MSVDRVVPVEEFDFLVDLLRGELVTPDVYKLFPHTPWTELVDFAEAAEDGEFIIGHAHVFFIGLNVFLCYWLELCYNGALADSLHPQ